MVIKPKPKELSLNESYQKSQKPVKESAKILDEQTLLETAAEDLLNAA